MRSFGRIEGVGKTFCGVPMTKSLLILTLMTTQVLAGMGATFYVCVGDDGSYCCIDAGPASCTCCHNDKEQEPLILTIPLTAWDGQDGGNSVRGPREQPRPLNRSADAIFSGDSCNCAHIPVMMSSEQPTTVARSPLSPNVEWRWCLFAMPSELGNDDHADTPHPLRRDNLPDVLDFVLTVVRTVVMRC